MSSQDKTYREQRQTQQKILRAFIAKWRALPGVRAHSEDGPTLAKAIETFGIEAVEKAIDELAAAGVITQVRTPIKFLWGWIRHADHRRKKRQLEDEAGARRRQETKDLVDRMDRARDEAACPPRETFTRLRVLAHDAASMSKVTDEPTTKSGTAAAGPDRGRAG